MLDYVLKILIKGETIGCFSFNFVISLINRRILSHNNFICLTIRFLDNIHTMLYIFKTFTR